MSTTDTFTLEFEITHEHETTGEIPAWAMIAALQERIHEIEADEDPAAARRPFNRVNFWTVRDEMAGTETEPIRNYRKANADAENRQCVLLVNGRVARDYSCDHHPVLEDGFFDGHD